MTLIPDINIFEGNEDGNLHQTYLAYHYDSLQLHQAPKLPFDVNDYLNFELNEDFISSSGDFINDYSTSDSIDSGNCFEQSKCLTKFDTANNTIQLKCELDVFDKENYDYEHDYNDVSRYGEFIDDNDDFCIKNYKLSSEAQPTLPSNDFKIFKYDHKDFNCSVITKQNNTPCKNKITCTFHTAVEKSKIQRCDTVVRLVKNFKYLQKLNEDFTRLSKSTKLTRPGLLSIKGSTRMKRHNSFNDNYHIQKKPQLMNPADILANNNSYYQEEENEDEFINILILKIGLLKTDPQDRLLEFQYKTELKNLATIEYYSQNNFTF